MKYWQENVLSYVGGVQREGMALTPDGKDWQLVQTAVGPAEKWAKLRLVLLAQSREGAGST